MQHAEQPRFNLDIDFLLLPSLEEMQDSSGDNVYSGPLLTFEMTATALENECRDKTHRWKDIVIHRLATKDPMMAELSPSEIIMSMTAWLGSVAGFSLFYKLLKMWSGLRKGRKIVIKLPHGLHIEATQLSERQFLRLIEGLAASGLLISKGLSRAGYDRTPYAKNEKAFEVFLANLKSSGLEVFDDTNMGKLENILYRAFRKSLDEIAVAPDFAERADRAMAKFEEWEAAGGHQGAIYLSDLQQEQAERNSIEEQPKQKKSRRPRKKKNDQAGE
jgi:hypothetical protein